MAIVGSQTVFAHDPGLSSANLSVGSDRIDAVLTFNQQDIANLRIPAEDLLARAVLLQLDGTTIAPTSSRASNDANSSNVAFEFIFPRPPGTRSLSFRSLLLKDLPFGHRQAVTARDASGRELSRMLLSAREDAASFSLHQSAGESATGGFVGFLFLGIRHILTGYDHLLFLFGLLVICRSVRSAALLITCFTAAHSLTLALSTFGLVTLSSRFVEAAIAVSILYVGIENVFRRDKKIQGRALLTFVFGLVHGLGFATVLREMGVAGSGSSAVVPLVAFNSGVELGQLSVAAIVLPVIWRLRSSESFRRVGLPACSVVVALAGGYWLLDRTVF